MLRSIGGAPKHAETLVCQRLQQRHAQQTIASSSRASIHSLSRCSLGLYTPTHPYTRNVTSATLPGQARQSRQYISLSPTHGRPTSTISSSSIAKSESANLPSTEASSSSKASVGTEGIQEKFLRLGLNANISRQIALTHPHIRQPTPAQSALIPAILSPTDVILRAHTGTGKSFGILLALLSKPRIVFRDQTSQDSPSTSKRGKPQTGIASIILVPSNELAFQYMRWARSLFPASTLPSLDPVIQCLVRGSETVSSKEELHKLKTTPPHILIGTPGRIKDILDTPAGTSLLGIDTLKTLVLDEADAVLQLPGRFPSHKQRWKHEVHKAPGLLILNEIMKRRATFSGGEKHLSAGLENRPGKRRDERRPPEHVRRNAYKAAERSAAGGVDANTGLALPKARGAGVHPLQLVATSATANSVMRHFFGARTGWLRTGAKDSGLAFAPQVGRWIDLTGLSGKSMVDQGIRGLFGANERSQTDSLIETSLERTPSTMPTVIEHTCIVVDEAPLSKQLSAVPLRNFEPKLARKKDRSTAAASAESSTSSDIDADDLVGDDFMIIKPENEPQEHEMDQSLIEALAFCFASEGVERGLALIPARWSLLKTRASLEALGVTVRLASDVGTASAATTSTDPETSANPELFLLQTTSSRGLDIPSLSHVFLVGYPSVIDAVQYVHSAGRVARIGGDPDAPTASKVVTLLRGLPHDTPLPSDSQKEEGSAVPKRFISTSEAKMANVFRRLGVVPKRFDLGLLTSGAADAAAAVTESEQPESVTEAIQSEEAATAKGPHESS